MKKVAALPISQAVELFNGLYARVGQKLGHHPSYISRVARGERRSEVIEKELDREFRRVVKLMMKSFTTSDRKGKKIFGK